MRSEDVRVQGARLLQLEVSGGALKMVSTTMVSNLYSKCVKRLKDDMIEIYTTDLEVPAEYLGASSTPLDLLESLQNMVRRFKELQETISLLTPPNGRLRDLGGNYAQ